MEDEKKKKKGNIEQRDNINFYSYNNKSVFLFFFEFFFFLSFFLSLKIKLKNILHKCFEV